MNANNGFSLGKWIRALHRDIGFFMVGLVVVYALSGIVLVFRDHGFLEREVQIEKKLAPGMDAGELGKALHIRDFKVSKIEGGVIWFQSGSYNESTGVASYAGRETIFPFNKFIGFHKTASSGPASWFAITTAILLLFLAISSFWMVKREAFWASRGIRIAGAGFLFTVVILSI